LFNEALNSSRKFVEITFGLNFSLVNRAAKKNQTNIEITRAVGLHDRRKKGRR